MAVTVHVASVIQKVVGDQKQLEADGSTIAELIADIEARYPGFRAQVADESGELHRFVNVYLNDEDVRYLGGTGTELGEGDSVSFLPALAGGGSFLPALAGGASFLPALAGGR